MANITSTSPKPIKPANSNVSVTSNFISKRSAINLLPGVNQTQTLTKFFNATVDHLLQPENVEFISGYIGSKPSYYDVTKDFYISEPTPDRQNYQLPATAISINPSSGVTTNVMFYDDLLNQLNLQGANIENPSRLLDGEYYSWSPPIDVDKFINFDQYYWIPNGPSIIQLLDQTDLLNQVQGKDSYTYTGSYKLLITNTVINVTDTTYKPLKFTSGMRIKVTNDVNYELNGRVLVIEHVGRGITVQDDIIVQNPSWDTIGWDRRGWDGEDGIIVPDYMTIERFSRDLNRWSVSNRWFHKDVVTLSGMNILEYQSGKASRPIIEFEANISLYNFGSVGRPDVDLVDFTNKDVFSEIAGKPSYILDGNTLLDGMRILVTADVNNNVNGRIYRVDGIEKYGNITLILESDGQNSDGSPAYGDCVYVIFGSKADNTFWYDGKTWKTGQRKIKYQPPVFAGYDKDGNSLNDPAIYSGSSFNGNKIFTYAIDSNTYTDSVLGLQVKRDQFGDYVFDNSLTTSSYTYIENGQSTDISGYIWYKKGDVIGNGWYRCANSTRQYILNSFDITIPTTTFLIDQRPADFVKDQLHPIIVNKINSTSTRLIYNVDYKVEGRIVTLTSPAKTGERIEIYSWSNNVRIGSAGVYQLPSNLLSNPNNEQPSSVSFNQTLQHFSQMISNQFGENGSGIGNTLWRDTAQTRGLGTSILQHRSPLLKLMMLNSTDLNAGMLGNNSPTDPSLAIQFAQREYQRFYNRFIRSLFNLYSTKGYSKANTPQSWIDAALTQVNLGKSKVSPWAYSGYEQNIDFSTTASTPTFIPPTAARLGVSPVYKPEVYLNYDYSPAKLVIQTHDGAQIIMEDLEGLTLGTIDQGYSHTYNPALLTHPVASAWLQLELNIYNSIAPAYKDIDAVPQFDQRIYIPGKWRTTDYTREEYLGILRPSFDKWIINSQVDYRSNVTFSINNQFSFNYSRCVDKQGQFVPGHWKGIYRWFYDTERPHTHPWEMLGFSQKPTWWDTEYGAAPYTRGNTYMWKDLRDGIIRQGSRAGKHSEWSRPSLMDCIPVDDQGDLLPPLLAGTVVSLPSLVDARAEWIFGDGAPIENVWLTSVEYNFVTALSGYLMKPARFIEQGWDPLRTISAGQNDTNQYLYIDTNRRRSSSEFYVHRENPSTIGGMLDIPNETNLTFFGSWGIQHWISEYLVSQNLSVTNYIGNILRGAKSVLAHKFGGFIGTDNSLRVMADSFGSIGYTSQIIPSENIKTYLYRSTSVGVNFYSGVVVIKQSNGWKIYGYDGINPMFTIIPSVQNGPKSTMVIGNQTVVDYQLGQGTETVPYGTVYGSRQEVYDFLVSYGRWLESQGWVFDSVNSDNGTVINWRKSAKDFINWSQGSWADGNFVALSPAAGGAKFQSDFGSIQYVNGTIGGTYPVLDKSGQPIEKQNLEILRQDGEILVQTINTQTIFGLRLFATTVEHIMIFDNVTQFNDLIYDPLYTVYQPRLKVYGYRTNGWTGRLDVPGYFLYQDATTGQWSMISNFEKTAEDFRNLYNVDQPKNITAIDNNTGELVTSSSKNHAVTRSDLSSLAKHLIGFQERQYMQNLLLDNTTEFQFYQGFIRQKGSRRALDSMLRNTSIIGAGQDISYYEEYALRKARYGSVSLNTNIDFILTQSEFVNNPQRIDVFSRYDSDQTREGVIELVARDPRIVVPPENYEGKLFPLRDTFGSNFYQDLPTAGYVQLGETTHYVKNSAELTDLASNLITNGSTLNVGDTVWQFITDDLSWNVWKLVKPTSDVYGTTSSSIVGNPTVINFIGPHGIVNGDLIVTSGFPNNSTLNNTFIAQNVTVSSVSVPVNTFIDDEPGFVGVYRSIRYHNKNDLDANGILGGWSEGDIAFVDNGVAENQWTVYQYHLNTWLPYRTETKKVNANLILQSKLYSKKSLNILQYLEYFDPAKGIIPGTADKEIDYKNVFDPAKYTNGDTTIYGLAPNIAWANSHVGEVWWDLSTTRYVDYEQGDITYKSTNWGKLASGTDIDIYEWVRSPIPPSDWATYVAGNTSLSQYGIDYIPSGVVRNSDSPAWTETVEYDSNGNKRTWYYFWVGNSDMPPPNSNRSLTINEIKTIIKNPSSNNLPWYAIISDRSLLLGNIYTSLNGSDTVIQIVYTNKENDANDYKDWTLISDGDPFSQIDEQYWAKMRDSLTGFDLMGNQVPDPHLNELQRYGTLIRPRQSWFKDRLAAIKIWTEKVNNQLSTADTPLILDPDKYSWTLWFTQKEPTPDAYGNWDYSVADMAGLNNLPVQPYDGYRVLVAATESNNNLWTIWTWDTSEFILTRVQSYNVENYWNYIDWYAKSYSSENIPTYTVDTIADLSSVTISGNQIAKVLNNGDGRWAWYDSTGLVALQDGTIEITENLWNSDVNLFGWDRKSFDSIPFDYNPTVELGIIFDGVKQGIYGVGGSVELNQLFFTMINYVYSEQKFVDWVFKTSFMLISGSNESLTSSQLYQPNTVDNLLDYLNEIKPYRSKVRDFISSRSTVDNVTVSTTDFDKPPYDGRILEVTNSDDVEIMKNDPAYSPWYNNYNTNSNLVRHIKTKLVFDRIASMPKTVGIINAVSYGNTVSFNVSPAGSGNTFTIGESINVTNVSVTGNSVVYFNSGNIIVSQVSGNVIVGNYGGNIGIGSGTGGTIYHRSMGAANRIVNYYKPTQYMPQLNSPDLISGTDFKGRIYSGTDFNLEPGWGVSPWDFAAGWDADAKSFDEYLEILLEGGMPPVYDQFYGTGSRTQFRLNKVAQDLLHTKVWRDNVLATYGVDYIIPNWATAVEVAYPGSGYKVGDILELIQDQPTPNSTNIQVRVTAIKPSSGAITKVEIVNKGFYTIIQHSPYIGVYAPYQSETGSGALFQPVWGGDTLIFTVPPLSSIVPNIWVLYAGTTFDPAPDGDMDVITDGNEFVQPEFEEDRPEELYVTKIRDAIRLDTYTQPVGGRPLVYSKIYKTDGVSDHYALGIRPHDRSAVFVYLDGSMLQYGVDKDYVINFETGHVVFMLPPPSGKVITTMAIGEGGSGNSVDAAYAVTGGSCYVINDSLTISGGLGTAAVITVNSVSATDLYLSDGGSKFKTGDILIMSNPSSTYTSRLCVKVDSVSNVGAITSASITSSGNYTSLPSSVSNRNPELNDVEWSTNGTGTGLVMSPIWGVNTVSVSTNGLYSIKPTSPVGHITTSTTGTNATFNLRFTSILDQQVFIADGNTGSYILRTTPANAASMLITVKGVIINNVILINNTIIIPTPDYGAPVVVTIFNTNQYSTAISSNIIAAINPDTLALSFTYNLLRAAYSTVPNYITTVVSVNGLTLPPPPIKTVISNGYTRQIDLYYMPTDTSYLKVYVNGTLQVIDTDYVIENSSVMLTYDPPENVKIIVVTLDPDYGYYYTLDTNTITFSDIQSVGFDDLGFDNVFGFDVGWDSLGIINENDEISVTNFSQDLSYGFVTEEFAGNPKGYYDLEGVPNSEGTVSVTINGIEQRLLWDYALVAINLEGYGAQGFDLSPYGEGSEKLYSIRFNENLHSPQDTVIIRYMTGKVERPATAFRQFIDSNKAKSSQVLANSGKTQLLSDIYVNTDEIIVEDISVLTPPSEASMSYVWINNERIAFGEITPSATPEYPKRGILSNLVRMSGGTSGNPINEYKTVFYDGDGVKDMFLSPSASGNETVWVNGKLNRIVPVVINGKLKPAEYSIVVNPPSMPAGRYVKFVTAPPVGYKNIRISMLTQDHSATTLCHKQGSIVQDSGARMRIPGNYTWEAAADGLQYSNSEMAQFILEHTGTRG